MLEIVFVMILCQKNSQKAAARGKSKVAAYFYTIGLWIGFEILGAFLAVFVLSQTHSNATPLLYVGALLCAAAGGLLSWVIASHGEPLPGMVGNLNVQEASYLSQQGNLAIPCQVVVHREKSFVGSLVAFSIQLNGYEVAKLKNGESTQFTTTYQRNVVTGDINTANRLKGGIMFDGLPGGRVEVYLKGNAFLPERTMLYPAASIVTEPAVYTAP